MSGWLTSVSREASRYQTKGMRIQCRGVVVGVCWVVSVGVGGAYVRVSTAGSSQSVTAMGCRELEGGQHGNRNGAVCHESGVSQAGLAPACRQVGGWYLFETRSDVGSSGARSRLRGRAGPSKPLFA